MTESSSDQSLVALGAASDIGLVRRRNEDSFRCRDDLGLWLVADGMGGPGGGDVASRIAADSVTEAVLDGRGLVEAAETAHRAITDVAGAGAGRPGMGSTLVTVRAEGTRYEICWVGDSRAYLWDPSEGGGGLQRLTHDHSLVQAMVDAGRLTEEEARVHPERNIITHVLGGNMEDCDAETVVGTLGPDQTLLLCTDGLTGELTDNEIYRVLLQSKRGPEMVEALIAAALESGGSDNVTVVLVGQAK